MRIVEKVIDVPVHKEVVRTVPVKKIVEVPREIVEAVHVVESRTIDQEVEVLGDIVQVPKPFLIENRVVVPRYVDFKVPTVVSQSLRPTFVESTEHAVEVRLREYVPELVPVSVFIPRPIERSMVVAGETQSKHVPIDVPLAQFNALVRELNRERESVLAQNPEVERECSAFQQQADIEWERKQKEETREAAQDEENHKSGAVTHMAAVNGELTELANAADARNPSFWTDQMMIAAPDGSVPSLPETVKLVFPENDDWKQHLNNSSQPPIAA